VRSATVAAKDHRGTAQVQDAAGERGEADRSLELALTMFNRIGGTGAGATSDKASALNGLGNVYYARGDLEAAIRNYRLALDLIPDYAYAWHDLLLVLAQQAEAGHVDLPAMENALSQVKSTVRAFPDWAQESWRNWKGLWPAGAARRDISGSAGDGRS